MGYFLIFSYQSGHGIGYFLVPSMRNFKDLVYGRFCIITKQIQKQFQIQLPHFQASLLHLFLNKYLIPFLINKSYPYTHFIPFLILLYSFSLPTNMDMKRQINMCFFKSMIFILIQIKFDIDINNDKLMKTIWNIRRKIKVDNCW
jgi:hypothetical protein